MLEEEVASGSTEGESEEGSSWSGESEADEEENEDEEEDEPVLKYRRFAAKEVVMDIAQTAGREFSLICCIAVHPKYIILGTSDGAVRMLDHAGNVLKDRVYHLHGSTINQISVDEEGEVMATCSDDGKVVIVGLLNSKFNNTLTFERQVKSVAVHPHYSRGSNHTFAMGTNKLVMMEERRWPLGNKATELDAGGGIISTIKWKENLLAWANDRMVIVYDTALKESISLISFEEESPRYLPCSLYWQSSTTLLVGRGHLVKTALVREAEKDDQQPYMPFTTDIDMVSRRKKYIVIRAQNTFPEFLVCGVVPVFEGQEWKLVVLGYDAEISQEAIRNGKVPPPHMVVASPGKYNPEDETFETPDDISREKLLPKGFEFCRCEEYHLECVLGDERFYILTPFDIILAQKRDANDHIEWLMKRRDFEAAMQFAENPQVARLLPPGKLQEIGIQYIYHLIKTEKYQEAAKKCPEMLGPGDRVRWEDIIYAFLNAKELSVILPFVPTNEPQLSPVIYELVLNSFLQEDPKMLYKVIEAWPTSLYNPQAIINAVEVKLETALEPEHGNLLKVKALLHEDLGQFEEALKIYLHQGHQEVFDLIHKRKLYPALVEHLTPLMNLDIEQAVKLLVKCRSDVQPQRVVKELEAEGNRYYLHKYLDGLFERDPKAGPEYHERQVELYAEYDSEKLLPFLRSCIDIPLQRALQVCEHYQRYEEMVYLLRRMGNPTAALELIINKLQDVEKAIEFAMEEGDEELWELLISLSVTQPKFITGLLHSVGTHIDPGRLIMKIPEKTEIPDLGSSLCKLLQDFQVQVNLRAGCKKILVRDSHDLMDKLYRMQKRAVYMDDYVRCQTCGAELVGLDDNSQNVVFFCGHMYHRRCVQEKSGVVSCRMCYGGSKLGTRRTETASAAKSRP